MTETQQAQPEAADKTPQHEIIKTALIVGVVALTALVLMAWS